MKLNRFLYTSMLLLGAFSLVLTSCKKDDDDGPDLPPADGNPEISILTPSNGLILAEAGETVPMSFQMFDNELIASYYVTTEVISSTGSSIAAESEMAGTRVTLSTRQYTSSVSYTVPMFYPPYTVIKVRGYVVDNKGKTSSALFNINVIPGPAAPTAWPIQDYLDGDTIWMGTTTSDYNFDLINRIHGDDADITAVNRDLREISTGTSGFLRQLSAPNTFGADSVLVTTDTTHFYFPAMTYQAVEQAFITSNKIGKTTQPLNVGSVAILKMSAAPHYAVIRVTAIGPDYIVFQYQYSHF